MTRNFDDMTIHLGAQRPLKCDRTLRGQRMRVFRGEGVRLAKIFASRLPEARARRKVPGLFVFQCPAGAIGRRACLRSINCRVRIPGGVPEFFARANALVLALLQLGCGKAAPPRGNTDPRRNSTRRAAGRCGLYRPRHGQFQSRCSAAAGARRSGRRGRRFESCRRDQRFLCSSADHTSARLRTARSRVRFPSGVPTRAPYLRRKSPRLSSGSARVQIPSAPPIPVCRAASGAADPYHLPRGFWRGGLICRASSRAADP